MNTKKCKKCGWEYPKNTPLMTCRFCGTPFTEGYCKACGEYSYDIIIGSHMCRTCYNKRSRIYHKRCAQAEREGTLRFFRKEKDKAAQKYAEWKKRLSTIQMHTLTEDEWLEACRYFNGCAMCGAESIDARGYFVDFKEGGKYNACNVIPLCESCATALKLQVNPFRRLNPLFNYKVASRRGFSRERLANIEKYLLSKIEEQERKMSEQEDTK